jgi:sugar phosphate isomerase/epimerase
VPGRGPISLCPLSTGAWDLGRDLELAARLGLTRTSVALAKVDAAGRPAGLEALAASGLEVDVVYPSGGLDLARPSSWADSAARLVDAVEVASQIGATGVMANGAPRGLGFEEARAAYAEALGPVRRPAADGGVALLLEPVRTQFAYANFVHTLRDGLAVAEHLDLGLVVDVTHCWWEPGLGALLAAAAPRAGTVHLADLRLDGPVLSRVVPGDGDLALGRFVDALLGAGYRGPFELEVMGPAIEAEGLEAALTRSVSVVEGLLAADRPG